jgi:hypothetical protein
MTRGSAGFWAGGTGFGTGSGRGMDAQIRIAGRTGGGPADLGEWLGDEDELRGRVRQ